MPSRARAPSAVAMVATTENIAAVASAGINAMARLYDMLDATPEISLTAPRIQYPK